MVLRATVRPMVGSLALYTTPMAPRPSSPMISYRPTVCRDMVVLTLRGCLQPVFGLGERRILPWLCPEDRTPSVQKITYFLNPGQCAELRQSNFSQLKAQKRG